MIADCNGLEAGSPSKLPITGGRAEVTVRMTPYSVTLITLMP